METVSIGNFLLRWPTYGPCAWCGLVCNTRHQPLCDGCLRLLKVNDRHCPSCALPQFEAAINTLRCGRCLQDAPAFNAAFTPWRYEEPLRHLLWQYKFQQQLFWSQFFAAQMVHTYQRNFQNRWPAIDCVVAVPAHAEHLKQRGFNQSALLAKTVAKKMARPFVNALQAVHPTESQTKLDYAARMKNLRHSLQWQWSDASLKALS